MSATKETFVDGNLAFLNSNPGAVTHTCDDVFTNVPAELRDKNTWLVWRFVPNDDPTKKLRKVPFNPKTGTKAKTTDPATWTSYSEAVSALKHGSFDGLGFVFDGSGICGVDLDNVIDPATGEIESWAQDEINYFGSYTETSPSGTGFHILFRSDFKHTGVNNGNLEVYSQGRFFTVTGVIYDPGLNTLEDCSEQHRRLYGEYAPKTPQVDELQAITCDRSEMTAEDKALCGRIMNSKQGQKFTNLFNGQWSEKYPSQSEADSALLFMLAFWTGKDSKQMDRIFRASKLYRDKWDSMRGDTTYGSICISKAIAGCNENMTAQNPTAAKAEDSFHAHVENPSHPSFPSLSGGYSSPNPSPTLHPMKDFLIEEYKDKKKLVPQSKAAEKISEMIQGQYAISVEVSVWYRFDSNYWRVCSFSEVETEITELIYQGAGELGFNSNYPRGIMDLLRKSKTVSLPQQKHRHIPFQNGLLEISTMQLIPISPENAMTWVLPCKYQKDAQCPNFLKWLEVSVEGDQETIRLLRSWINAVLVGRPELQRFLHLLGPAGTGKSTFLRLIFHLVGRENFTTTSLKQLETNRFEAANIYGKRLVSIEEADKYGGSVSILKSMTGQDPLRLERKNQQQQGSFTFDGQTLITSNERIATNDNSNGIERRRITVEFSHWIVPEERSAWDRRGGEEKILWPEIPGIINWSLHLTDDDVRASFQTMPDRIRKANLEAARVNNSVLDWMVNNLIPDETASTQVGDRQEFKSNGETHFKDEDARLYPNYLFWSQCNGRKPVSTRSFTDILLEQSRSYGVTCRKVRKKDGTMIEGLRIRQDVEDSWLSILVGDAKGEGSVKSKVKDNLLKMHEMKDKSTFPTSSIEKNLYEVIGI